MPFTREVYACLPGLSTLNGRTGPHLHALRMNAGDPSIAAGGLLTRTWTDANGDFRRSRHGPAEAGQGPAEAGHYRCQENQWSG